MVLISILLLVNVLKVPYRRVWRGSDLSSVERVICGIMARFVLFWHGYEVHGLDKVSGDNSLLVGYHSRCIIDVLYFASAVQFYSVAHSVIMNTPVWGQAFRAMGCIPSNGGGSCGSAAETAFVDTLSSGKKPLMVLPGGMFEFLKPYADIGKVIWPEEAGFARIIVRESAKLGRSSTVIPYYTKNCERVSYIAPWWYDYTSRVGRDSMAKMRQGRVLGFAQFFLVLPVCMGFLLFPRPVKLDTHFAEPLRLQEGESAATFTERVRASLQALIDRVEALPERPFPGGGRPSLLSFVAVGAVVSLFNLANIAVTTALFVAIAVPVMVYRSVTWRRTAQISRRVAEGSANAVASEEEASQLSKTLQ